MKFYLLKNLFKIQNIYLNICCNIGSTSIAWKTKNLSPQSCPDAVAVGTGADAAAADAASAAATSG